MAALAAHERRWRELAAWLLGLAAFAALMLRHADVVASLVGPGDKAQTHGWLQFGGWAFVLKTAHMHPLFLAFLPTSPWIVATLLPLALAGLCRWRGRLGPLAALTVLGYAAAYCCAGQSFNYLWGLMYVPLWPLGLLFFPAALREGLDALRRPASSRPALPSSA
jgi:hypothetical protein